MRTSDYLTVRRVYSRADLNRLFGITDATINNGVFRPKGHESIWLFVTENKTPDRTQYTDQILADELYIDGQSAGRTDKLLIEHEKRGCEIVVFYRRRKDEHPNGAFLYEGRFRYVEHSGKHPAHFTFKRAPR